MGRVAEGDDLVEVLLRRVGLAVHQVLLDGQDLLQELEEVTPVCLRALGVRRRATGLTVAGLGIITRPSGNGGSRGGAALGLRIVGALADGAAGLLMPTGPAATLAGFGRGHRLGRDDGLLNVTDDLEVLLFLLRIGDLLLEPAGAAVDQLHRGLDIGNFTPASGATGVRPLGLPGVRATLSITRR